MAVNLNLSIIVDCSNLDYQQSRTYKNKVFARVNTEVAVALVEIARQEMPMATTQRR